MAYPKAILYKPLNKISFEESTETGISPLSFTYL